ncbi:MAG: hypothetical protein IT461_12205 [Planctomycetes bacterium]|nr:hypothetical protein [Planctomycetota bacterium]
MLDSLIPGIYDLLQDRDISKLCKAVKLMAEEIERLHGETARLNQQMPGIVTHFADILHQFDSRLRAIEVVVASSQSESRSKAQIPFRMVDDAKTVVAEAVKRTVEEGEAAAARNAEFDSLPETQRIYVECRNCGKRYTNTKVKVQRFPACQTCGVRPFDFHYIAKADSNS